jgi:hypothetical protein
MLLYAPPFPMVDGVSAVPDHADSTTYHYLPAIPELARDERGGPAFAATAFLPEVDSSAGEGDAVRAVLSLDVELPVRPETLMRLREELEDRWDRKVKRLVPAQPRRGTVVLEVVRPGQETNDGAVRVYQGHSPSLLGTNRAAFALAATGLEAQTLMAALTVRNVPAVMTYALEFLGLAPSFRATMHVRWSEVYRNLRELAMTNFLFGAEEMDRVVEDLRQAGAVDIEVLEQDPEGASAATTALFNELKSQIVQKLFSPPRQQGDVPIEDRIGRGVRNVLIAIMPGVTHTLRELDQNQLSDTMIDLREQRVNVYPAYPQSTLTGLLERAGGVQDRVRWVALDELPNRVEEVVVDLAPGADALGVRRVDVQVRAEVPGRAEPLLDRSVGLDAAAPARTVMRFRRQGGAEPTIRYRADVTLDAAAAPEGRETWSLDWRTAVGGRVYVDAESLLDVAQVRLELDDPGVLEGGTKVEMAVEALLVGETKPFSRAEVVFGEPAEVAFSESALSKQVRVVVPEGRAVWFRGREIFRRPGEPDFVRDVPTLGSVHRVRNPFGQRWTMEIHAAGDWRATEVLLAELRLWDVERRVWLRGEHRFTEGETVWTPEFQVSPGTPRAAEIRLTRVGHDRSITQGPWRDLAGAVVSIDDHVRAERRIRVRIVAPHWQRDGARKARVGLRYDYASPPPARELELAGDGAVGDWTHPFPDPSRPRYRWQVRVVGNGGERYVRPWDESAADDLEITLPEPLWK